MPLSPRFRVPCAALAGIAISSLLGVAGCGVSRNGVQAPADAPRFTVSVAASEVTLINGTNAEDARALGAEAIDAMKAGTGEGEPARFRARVTTDAAGNGGAFFYCVLPLAPFTLLLSPLLCPIGRLDVSVDLTVEAGGHVFSGVAELSSFLSDGDRTEDWRALVYNAFQQAMLDALKKPPARAPAKTASR